VSISRVLRSTAVMRVLKVALIALAVLVLIGLGTGAYLASRLDRDHLVRAAQTAVKEATGRTLEVGGKVDLRIFTPELVVENIRFSNASWGSRPDMLRARRVEVELALIPLITGTISIDRLIVIEPNILLETDAKGRANWEFQTDEVKGKPADAGGRFIPAIRFGAFRVSNGLIVYRDGARGTQTRVEIKIFDRKPAGFGRRYPLAVKGSVNGRPFEVNGTIGDPSAVLATGGVVELDLKISAQKVQADAKGRLVDLLGRADAHVQVQIEAKDVQDVAAQFGRKIPPLGSLRARATIDRNKGRLGVSDLDLVLGQPGALEVTARGRIRDITKPAGAALEMTALVPESNRLPAVRASGRVEDVKDGVRVTDLKITSGKNELKGDLEYHPGKTRPRVTAQLEGSGLDLRFLAADRGSKAGDKPSTGSPLFSREPLPLDHLRAVDAEAQLRVGALVMPNGIALRNFSAKLGLNDGKLRIEPVNFVAGGGQTSAMLRLDGSGKVPGLRGELQGRRVVIGDLLEGTANAGKIKGGATDVDITLATAGSSPHEWAAGLNGTIRISGGPSTSRSRELDYGSDLLTNVAEVINPFRKTDPDTHVECLGIRVLVKDGVVHSDRGIGFETNKMSVLSSGIIDLGKEVLDMNIRPRAKEGIGLGGARLAQMVRLTGPLADPKLGLDFGGAVGTAASLAAGVATMGLSLLGEQLLHSATNENACKVALRLPSPDAQRSVPGPEGSAAPGAAESGAPQPAEEKKERGFFDRIFGK